MNRAQRRQLARRNARELGARMESAAERGEVPFGYYSASGKFEFAGDQDGVLPERVYGHHRWIATAGYTLTDDDVRLELRSQGGSGERQYLDHSTLFTFGVGCYDCEQILGQVTPDSFCAGEPAGGE